MSAKISAGKVPPSTGAPANSVSIGVTRVGVADPDAGGDLARSRRRTRRRRCRRWSRSCPRSARRSGAFSPVPEVTTVDSTSLAVAATPGRSPAWRRPRSRRWRRSGRGPAPVAASVIAGDAVARFDLDDPDRAAGARRPSCPRAAAVRRQGVVGVRHLERRDAGLEPAEDQRRVVGLEGAVVDRVVGVGREVGLDAHLLRGRGDVLGPDLRCRAARRRSCRSRWSRSRVEAEPR